MSTIAPRLLLSGAFGASSFAQLQPGTVVKDEFGRLMGFVVGPFVSPAASYQNDEGSVVINGSFLEPAAHGPEQVMHSIDIDALTARITAFDSFADLVHAEGGYRPTLLAQHGQDQVALADAYDAHQESVGDERRAYRGNGAAQARLENRRDGNVLSVRLTSMCPHGKASNQCCGYAEWLRVIHAINAQRDGWIGTPLKSYDWWAGGWAEEYPDFRVILKDEVGTNYVQAKTAEAADALRAAVLMVTGRLVDDNGMAV